MNNITLTGNNTRDIELTYSQSGTAFAKGSIAVRRDFKNKETNEYDSDFFNFTAIGQIGKVMADYIKKGDHFGITGRLQNRVWEKEDGTKQYFTEIIVNGFDFPQKRQNGQNSNENSQGNTNTANRQQNQNQGQNERYNDAFGSGQIDISSDDLPF